MKNIKTILTAIAVYFTVNFAYGQGNGDMPTLHINTRWKQCSIQLDPSLTQAEWRRFTREAGLVTYFRPLADARPMGIGRFEFSILQWNSGIDERDGAWNNTFVHPHSEHWLIGGDKLPFPGISLRAGITRKLDAAIYWTFRPGANYGVAGAQAQYNLINDSLRNWAASARLNFSSLYGPDDMNLNVYGVDLLASKKFRVISDKISVSPYAGVSSYLSHSHEKTEAVNLNDENIVGMQGMVGTAAQIYWATIGVEYNFASINTLSYKLGVNFKF